MVVAVANLNQLFLVLTSETKQMALDHEKAENGKRICAASHLHIRFGSISFFFVYFMYSHSILKSHHPETTNRGAYEAFHLHASPRHTVTDTEAESVRDARRPTPTSEPRAPTGRHGSRDAPRSASGATPSLQP